MPSTASHAAIRRSASIRPLSNTTVQIRTTLSADDLVHLSGKSTISTPGTNTGAKSAETAHKTHLRSADPEIRLCATPTHSHHHTRTKGRNPTNQPSAPPGLRLPLLCPIFLTTHYADDTRLPAAEDPVLAGPPRRSRLEATRFTVDAFEWENLRTSYVTNNRGHCRGRRESAPA